MVDKSGSFASRFEALRGALSYQALSDAIATRTGIRVTPQAMHLWSRGGEISEENLKVVAEFFGVTRAWLRYGEEPGGLERTLGELPAEMRREILEYARFKIERAAELIASDKIADYLGAVDGFAKDAERRLKKNN